MVKNNDIKVALGDEIVGKESELSLIWDSVSGGPANSRLKPKP